MLPANDFATKVSLGLFALKLRLLGRKDMLELTRILTMNVADLATDFFESDAIKGLLAFDATLGVYLGPRSPNTVFNLLYRLSSFSRHGMRGLYLPMGGMGALAEALTKSAQGRRCRRSHEREGRAHPARERHRRWRGAGRRR